MICAEGQEKAEHSGDYNCVALPMPSSHPSCLSAGEDEENTTGLLS